MVGIEEAIKTAITYEVKVTGVYKDALGRSTDEVGKRVFQVLADEEKKHVEFLEGKLKEWQETGTVTAEAVKTAIPPRDKIAQGVEELEERVSRKTHGTEMDLLRNALAVEAETSAFYRKMVKELPPEGKALFEPFLEIEEGHLAIVQAEIDYLSGTGYWFDFKEFDMV